MRGFEALRPTLIVPGHGNPGDLGIAAAVAAQIDRVGLAAATARAAGLTPEAAAARLRPQVAGWNPDWDHPELIDWQLRYALDQRE